MGGALCLCCVWEIPGCCLLLRQIVEWCVLPLTQVGCRSEEMAAVTGVETGALLTVVCLHGGDRVLCVCVKRAAA